ncbi:hypothetical protein [Novosphingobium sp. HII-3]|uniref:hypothetical protein n=1 Tax=Novosphingobium sp. HII-3 TaxID=2075565 RepID=UPI0011AFA414|nr:hypothetical protein [Novosphingobium sp. HII-3]
MKRTHTCGTCMHFRPGAASDMTLPAPLDSTELVGVCEAMPPETMPRMGPPALIGLQPAVHASRSCAEYLPNAGHDGDGDGGGDDDGGEPVPAPASVHVLRPRAAASL